MSMSISSSPLIQIEPHDPKIRETFHASCRKKSVCERLTGLFKLPLYPITTSYNFLRNTAQIAIRSRVYQACSQGFTKKMDGNRLEKSRECLRQLGGQTVLLYAEDGNPIEGMFIDVDNFRRQIISLGGQFLVRSDGKYVLRSYDQELSDSLQETFKFKGSNVSCPQMLDLDTVFEVELPFHGGGVKSIDCGKQVQILTQGNACIFEMDRKKIGSVLLSGQSCIAFNLRGTGRSHGSPNENGSYLDIETVCQYLNHKGFGDNQILVNGYCLGAGLAVDLAARRKVHLILDRPFAKIGDVIGNVIKEQAIVFLKIPKKGIRRYVLDILADDVIPEGVNRFLISYNNAKKIRTVRGPICYIHSNIDNVIPKKSREKFKQAVQRLPNATIQISDFFGHCDDWDPSTNQVFLTHLQTFDAGRKYLLNKPAPRIALYPLIRLRKEAKIKAFSNKAEAAVVTGAAIQAGPIGAAAAFSAIEGVKSLAAKNKS